MGQHDSYVAEIRMSVVKEHGIDIFFDWEPNLQLYYPEKVDYRFTPLSNGLRMVGIKFNDKETTRKEAIQLLEAELRHSLKQKVDAYTYFIRLLGEEE